MSISIREMSRTTDVADLLTFLPSEQVARIEIVHNDKEASIALVAIDSGRIVGWILAHLCIRTDLEWVWDEDAIGSLTGVNACVEYLHVHHEFHRRSIGSAQLKQLKTLAHKRGKNTLWLHVARENEAARGFYVRYGWRLEKEVMPVWAPERVFCIYRKALC